MSSTHQQQRLRISEIFYSLQGETNTVGLPTVFIRLTGCPLRCQYCDSEYAFKGGQWRTLDEILLEVSKYNTSFVTVTGGEPLAQPNCLPLLEKLLEQNLTVSLETSGALPIDTVDPRVVKILDIKTPDSGEASKNLWSNLNYLTDHDQIKFVICSRSDFDWAVQQINYYDLASKAEILFSPSYEQLPARELADWILEQQLDVRMQIQLHKYLWGDVPGK